MRELTQRKLGGDLADQLVCDHALFHSRPTPVALGVALAIATGVGLGALLLQIVSEPVRVDVAPIVALGGAGAGVAVLVPVLSLPVLWRLMRPQGLRAE